MRWLLVLFLAVAARGEVQPLAAELSRHAHPVQWSEGTLSGPGAVLLERELATTQFFLVGEDHGMREVPELTQALLRRGWASGYRHLALELGPVTMRRLNAQAGTDPFAAVAAYNRRYPWALPFLFWQEDARLYAEAMKLGNGRADAVWGLDQEFIISAVSHLERLLALAGSDASRHTVQGLLERARAGDREMAEKKSPRTVWFASASAEDFASLRAAFAGHRRAEVQELLDELEESWRIYAMNFAGDQYGNNVARAEQMKRHFREAYQAAQTAGEKLPRVLLRFGASHMMRGRSLVHVYDLGSMLPELAAANGTRSFQMFVVATGGRANQYRPFSTSEADKSAAYAMNYSGVDLKPLAALAPGGQWTLIDLRPVHALLSRKKLGTLDPALEKILWGFDAILVIPEVTPATNF